MMEENNNMDNQELTNFDIYEELDDLDKAIINMKIAEPAVTDVEIAKTLKVHRITVANRMKKVKLQAVLKGLQKTALQILLDGQAIAARRLVKIVKNETSSDADSIRASREILKGVLKDVVVNINMDRELTEVEEQEVEKELGLIFNKNE
jgi:DNA-binding Lrp family transcriptional regulator